MTDCIFCKIIEGTIPSQKVYENDKVLVIKDINPAAPVHVLIMPKEHIESMNDAKAMGTAADIFAAARETATILGVAENGYRIINNCGKNAGQTVMHLHFHLISGIRMGEKII
jgi:histidine triad (HIT) family protein